MIWLGFYTVLKHRKVMLCVAGPRQEISKALPREDALYLTQPHSGPDPASHWVWPSLSLDLTQPHTEFDPASLWIWPSLTLSLTQPLSGSDPASLWKWPQLTCSDSTRTPSAHNAESAPPDPGSVLPFLHKLISCSLFSTIQVLHVFLKL